MNFKGKNKNVTIKSSGHVLRTSGNRSSWEKAIVTLEEGSKIDMLGGDVQMPVRKLKPDTPSRRYMSVSTFEEVTAKRPERSLTTALRKTRGSELILVA